MIVRKLETTDIVTLPHTCYSGRPLHEVEDDLRRRLFDQEKGRLVCLIAEVNGQAVASGQLGRLRSKGEIGSLVVAPGHRRQGIGTALVRALIQQARQHKLHTLEITANTSVPWICAWYERLGFVYQREHDFPGERVAILTMDLTQGDLK